jgi:hypothetical protein
MKAGRGSFESNLGAALRGTVLEDVGILSC